MYPICLARSAIFSLVLGVGLVSTSFAQVKVRQMRTLDMAPPSAISRSIDVGAADAAKTIHLAISLPYRDQAAMEKFVDSVSDPKSPTYRQFLTPEEIGARFGQSSVDIKKVTDYLSSAGMKVRLVSKTHLAILADSTVAQAQSAFKVSIREFKTVNPADPADSRFRSFTSAPSVPADIRPLILDIAGLETYTRPKHQYLLPSQIRSLYNVKPLYSSSVQGQGRTIAISSWDGYRLSYLSPVYTQWGLPVPPGGVGSNVTVVPINNGQGGGTNSGEADLDIQAILTVAPLANLIIYDGGTTPGGGYDYIALLTKESDDNKADIISESYGWDLSQAGNTDTAAHNVHLAMNAQGITYMAASGDSGAALGRFNYPFYDPEVLLVGGTTAAVDGNGVRSSETAWSGSGSGYVNNASAFNVLPSYQKGNGVPTNIAKRLGPDVALNADPDTGYVVYWTTVKYGLGFYVIGGTSGASPTFAAALAIAQQQMISLGTLPASAAGKYRHGRIQDLIYSFNGSPTIFFDVISGSATGTMPNGQTATAKAGWDFVTGWGAMDFKAFSDSGVTPPTVSTLAVSPTTVVGGSATTVTGTVTLSKSAPAAGTVVNLSSSDTSATVPTTVTVNSGKTTATFNVSTTAVTVSKSVTLTAAIGAGAKTTTLTVTPVPAPTTIALTFSSARVNSGATSTGTVTLDNPAPTGGLVINLTSSRTSALTVPATVTVAAGAKSNTFTAQAKTVAAALRVTITASSSGFTNATGTQTVLPPAVTTVTFGSASVVGGNPATGTVTVGLAAPTGGLVVNLTSASPSATVPATVKVAAGMTTATFTVSTAGVASNVVATFKAGTTGTALVSARLTLTPASLATVSASPNPVPGSQSTTGTVTLNGAAPAGGLVIALVSSSTALQLPSSVTIPAGSNHVDFTCTTTTVRRDTNARITATLGTARGVFVVVTIKK